MDNSLFRLGLIIAIIFSLASCGNEGLRTVRKTGLGPDEFKTVPFKPLAYPEDHTNLPPPTPGGWNLATSNPFVDAMEALGGQIPVMQDVPSGDTALVSYSTRFGPGQDIRAELDAEDTAFRQRKQRWSNLRLVDRYNTSYRSQWLDPKAESERLRNSGIPVSSAPPSGG